MHQKTKQQTTEDIIRDSTKEMGGNGKDNGIPENIQSPASRKTFPLCWKCFAEKKNE